MQQRSLDASCVLLGTGSDSGVDAAQEDRDDEGRLLLARGPGLALEPADEHTAQAVAVNGGHGGGIEVAQLAALSGLGEHRLQTLRIAAMRSAAALLLLLALMPRQGHRGAEQ